MTYDLYVRMYKRIYMHLHFYHFVAFSTIFLFGLSVCSLFSFLQS